MNIIGIVAVGKVFEIKRDDIFSTNPDNNDYVIGKKIKRTKNFSWWASDEIIFCRKELGEITGIKLKPGEKAKFRLVQVK